MKHTGALILSLLIPVVAHASDPGAPAAEAPAPQPQSTPAVSDSTVNNERDAEGLLMLANALAARNEFNAAETAYEDALQIPTPRAFRERALLAYARLLRDAKRDIRAVAMFQRFFADHPDSESAATAHLELGRVMRRMGLTDGALTQFYSVLNSTLKISSGELASYRSLTQVAMFEIAETHFSSGNFEAAQKSFGRITLLDIPDSDRARAMYRQAHSYHLAGDFENSVRSIRAFVGRYPDDANANEARHYLALGLRKLHRSEEALQETLLLLRRIDVQTEADSSTWGYWQRRTGNQVGNDFYQQGDFRSAMKIYERLANLRSDPDWRWPALYQYGLCLERLRQTDRAIAVFRMIAGEAAGAGKTGDEASDIAHMAAWRMEHLGWTEDLDRQIIAQGAPETDG